MAERASGNRLIGTRTFKIAFITVLLVVFPSVIVLIQRPHMFYSLKSGDGNLQSTVMKKDIIFECLQKADVKTYEAFMVGFKTPNHPCSFIGLDTLVSILRDIIKNNNMCTYNSDKLAFSSKELESQQCHSNGLLSNEPEDNIVNNGKTLTVHEFMKHCSAYAPRWISFSGRTMQNKTVSEDALPVPNIVHYVWFGRSAKFTFLIYLSFLGVHKFIKPDAIYLHGDNEPNGKWWNHTLTDYFVYKPRPLYIFGKKIRHIEHSADIARYEIVNDCGGIYLDTDVLVVKSFDPLRKFDLTLGRESPSALSNGIIIARRGAPFFRLWIETYRTFNPDEWAQHSVQMAGTLQKIYPTLVHVELGTLVTPDFHHAHQVFQKGYDWSKNYAVHIWRRNGKVPTDVEGIKKLDTLLGELMRYIYFGSKKLVT